MTKLEIKRAFENAHFMMVEYLLKCNRIYHSEHIKDEYSYKEASINFDLMVYWQQKMEDEYGIHLSY